jgi:hypothetical protein
MVALLKRYWMVLVAIPLGLLSLASLTNPALKLERTYERQARTDTAYYAERAEKQNRRDCLKLSDAAQENADTRRPSPLAKDNMTQTISRLSS